MKNFIKNYSLFQNKNKRLLNIKQFYFSIFVKTQSTPNPHFLKFMPGKELLKDGETYEFTDIKQSLISPLARKIFEVIYIFVYKPPDKRNNQSILR